MTSSPIPAGRSQYLLDLLAQVPDPRKKRGHRHPLAGRLAVGIAAVIAGSRSFAAIGQWAADAGPEVLAVLGAARGPAEESTFRRAFALVSADVLDRVLGAWLHTRAVLAGGRLVIAIDGKTVRGAKDKNGKAPHLVAALAHGIGAVLGQVAVDAKSNEIPAVRELLKAFTDLAGAVVTIDAMHTQHDTAQAILGRGADYVMTVEHASHCSCCLSWRVKQSSLAASDLDTQAFAASLGEVDGVELAALDLVQHGLAGDAEVAGGLAEGQPAVGCLGPDAVAELLVDADLPGCSGSELLAGDKAVAQPPVDGGAGDAELAGGFADADHGCIIAAGCDIFGRRLVSGDAVVGA
jgi:DDE_Tnp_1-associated/Transposase DDE domain